MKPLSRLGESEAPGMHKLYRQFFLSFFGRPHKAVGWMFSALRFHLFAAVVTQKAYLGVNRLYSNEQEHSDSCHDRQAAQSTGALMPHLHKRWWLLLYCGKFFTNFSLFLNFSFTLRPINFQSSRRENKNISNFHFPLSRTRNRNRTREKLVLNKERINFPSISIQQ